MAEKPASSHFNVIEPPQCMIYNNVIPEGTNYFDCDFIRESHYKFDKIAKKFSSSDYNFITTTQFNFDVIDEESASTELKFIQRPKTLYESDSSSDYSESSEEEFFVISNKSNAKFNEALAAYTREVIQKKARSLRSVLQYEITTSSSEELSDDDYTYELVRKHKEMDLLKNIPKWTFNFETDTEYESEDSELSEQTSRDDLSVTPKADVKINMNDLTFVYSAHTINKESLQDFRFNPNVGKQFPYRVREINTATDCKMVNTYKGQWQEIKNKYAYKNSRPRNMKEAYQLTRDSAIFSMGSPLFCPAKYKYSTDYKYPKTVKTRLFRMPIKSSQLEH